MKVANANICEEVRETVMNLLSGCKVMVAREYIQRHKCAEDFFNRIGTTRRHYWIRDSMVEGKVRTRKNN